MKTILILALAATACAQSVTISAPAFTGVGLNDATSGGSFTALPTNAAYAVAISATGTPDSFRWQKSGGSLSSAIPITGSSQTLSDGVTIKFGATTGHTLLDAWLITANARGSLAAVNTIQSGVGAKVRTAEDKAREIISVTDFGAIADGTAAGNVGTDQVARFQAAADACLNRYNCAIFIPNAGANCYMIGAPGVLTHSNTTWYSDSRETCVQWKNSATSQIFRTDNLAASSNVHWRNFTIDGNRANATGIAGDGGNYSIFCAGCSDSSIENMLVKNSYTDGIVISCYGDPAVNTGNGFTVFNTRVTNARRNGGSQNCGLNTKIINSRFDNTNGTDPEAGFDLEPFLRGQINTGFTVLNTEFDANNSHGLFINYTGADDPAANFLLDAYAHGNCLTNNSCGELFATAYYPLTGLTVRGRYVSTNTSAAASLWINGGFTNVAVMADAKGAARGVYLGNVNTHVALGPGTYSGGVYDLSIDGLNVDVNLAGAVLQSDNYQAGAGQYILAQPLTGYPLQFTAPRGLAYWGYPVNDGSISCTGAGTNTITCAGSPAPGSYYYGQAINLTAAATNTGAATLNVNGLGAKSITNGGSALVGGELVIGSVYRLLNDNAGHFILVGRIPRSGKMSVSTVCTVIDPVNPGLSCSDGTITTKMQTASGVGGVIGTESNHSLGIYTNSISRIGISASGAVTIPGTLAVGGANVVTSGTGSLNCSISGQAVKSVSITNSGTNTITLSASCGIP